MESMADAPTIRRLAADLAEARAAQQAAHDELAVMTRLRGQAEQRALTTDALVQRLIGELLQFQHVEGKDNGQRLTRAPF